MFQERKEAKEFLIPEVMVRFPFRTNGNWIWKPSCKKYRI